MARLQLMPPGALQPADLSILFIQPENQSMAKFDITQVHEAKTAQDRARILERFAVRIAPGAALQDGEALDFTRLPQSNVPHPFLRQALLRDPAMAALLAATPVSIGLGTTAEVPFRVTRSGVLMLPTAFITQARCLAAIARWGLELVHLLSEAGGDPARRTSALAAAFYHGAMLLKDLSEEERAFTVSRLPEGVSGAVLEASPRAGPGEIAWLAGLVDGLQRDPAPQHEAGAERALQQAIDEGLCSPVERVLASGGDSRLAVDPKTGLNRYGTTPRPRPEAIHFSSSTASSITDYGFAICDWTRRKLLQRILFANVDPGALRRAYRDSIERELLALLNLDDETADLVVAPSGTDTELLAVLLALAADERPLTNILIAPEETGRGVVLAGSGQYFDDISATGAPIAKGAPAWPARKIETRSIPVRNENGSIRLPHHVHADVEEQVREAIARGDRILLHVLIGSKTGISAPDLDFVETLVAEHKDQIDVVVDACQLRAPIELIGDIARRGWLLQVSGSKFLTGPPFSGALVVPASFRDRAEAAARLLAAAPGVGAPEDWNRRWWPQPAPGAPFRASFGSLFRWTPALAEAYLLQGTPPALSRHAFNRFREALESRLARSDYLEHVETPEGPDLRQNQALPGLGATSIASFAVSRPGPDGQAARLSMPECQRVFELLNLDLSDRIPDLDPLDRVLSQQPAHIGQPVELQPQASGSTAILRLVIGARFFTAIGFAGTNAAEAALESEIADAIRALDKLEMIVRHIDRF